MSEEVKSKMQTIIDKIELANKAGCNQESIAAVVEALKLLAQGQRQVMGDLDQSRYSGQQIN